MPLGHVATLVSVAHFGVEVGVEARGGGNGGCRLFCYFAISVLLYAPARIMVT